MGGHYTGIIIHITYYYITHILHISSCNPSYARLFPPFGQGSRVDGGPEPGQVPLGAAGVHPAGGRLQEIRKAAADALVHTAA